MTKKNAKKGAARARKAKLGGKYQAHLRLVGGADGGKPPSFFQGIADAIHKAFPEIGITHDPPKHRLFVRTGERELVVCTPVNAPPEWPAIVLLPDTPDGDTPSWECANIDDILTVLRWPGAHPSGHYASPDEIRDALENDAKHVWERIQWAHPMGPLVRTVQCRNCKEKLHIYFGETVEEIARIAFDNWRRRAAGRHSFPGTLTRAGDVRPIPPQCSLHDRSASGVGEAP